MKYLYIIECDEGNGYAVTAGFISNSVNSAKDAAENKAYELKKAEPENRYNVVKVPVTEAL